MNIEINGSLLIIDGDSVAMTRVSINIFKILFNESPNVVPNALMRELLNGQCGIMKRHTLTQQTSLLRKKLQQFKKVEIITHHKVGYSLNIKGKEIGQIKTVGIDKMLWFDKTAKYHWHSFVFQDNPISSFNKVSTVNFPSAQKEITEATLVKAKKSAGVLPESACLNIIYLGCMTQHVFTTK